MQNRSAYLVLLSSISTLFFIKLNPSLADGIFNNIENAKLIQSSSIVPTDGNYVFKNVATGQIIQHDRKNDVPNIYTSAQHTRTASHPHHHPRARARSTHDDDDDAVEVSPLELRSHGTRTKWISIRTTATSGDPKCISAQWGYHTEGGADHAGTLYQCVVDPLNLEATLEKPKQWWLLMPVEAAKGLNSEQTLDLKNEILDQNKAMKMQDAPIVSRIVDQEGKTSIDQLDAPFWNPKTKRIENFSSSSSSSNHKNKRYYNHEGEISRAQQLSLLRKHQLQNSLPNTSVINSTGDVPVAAPAALKVIQDEPHQLENDKGVLMGDMNESPLKTLGKRSKHHHHKSKSASKSHSTSHKQDDESAPGTLGPFYVVSVDHVYDMETRVWTNGVKTTVGNQLSLVLKKLDPNDTTQQWYLQLQT
ncbi:hypothetical protein PCASD_18819 [Puccinia coronata f. sp. avenae]|uniref:Ricin B lectin domain-containing protein n=1 Tax=Puccinia coronata f. sp. avenae TaxID=200324 RepID=A0A2N5TPD4_9BASI|nr:hypothetical protein PCASD_18819 [Puccinia coronata f. sp. avenae]